MVAVIKACQNMKVLLLSQYGRLAASSRLRTYQYLPFLENSGIEVTTAPLLDNWYVEGLASGLQRKHFKIAWAYAKRLCAVLSARKYDLVWLEKEVFPWIPAWATAWLQRMKTPYVVDYDDAAFHRYDQSANPAIRSFLGNKIDTIMRRSALVVAGNNYLAERARIAGAKRVEMLPTVIDLDHYQGGDKPSDDPFTIGWIGSPTTAIYLRTIREALQCALEHNECRVVLVGAPINSLDGLQVEYATWSEETEVQEVFRFDVGIMPLPDSPWARGKCGYKLIQYMGCSLPVIASPVGMNSEIVEDGKTGILAESTDDWVNALESLRADSDLCRRMGRAGREKAEREYSLQVTAPKLAALLKSSVERHF